MKYVYTVNGIVSAILFDNDPKFPLNKRYPETFLNGCIQVGDDVPVQEGWAFNGETFEESPQPEPIPPAPTEVEKFRADVDYIAMETGITLDV